MEYRLYNVCDWNLVILRLARKLKKNDTIVLRASHLLNQGNIERNRAVFVSRDKKGNVTYGLDENEKIETTDDFWDKYFDNVAPVIITEVS